MTLLILATVAGYRATPANAGEAAARPAPAQSAHLQALPADTSAAELDDLMRRYNQELGVRCSYCHSENPQTRQPDYAADGNPAKQTARLMIAMLREINNRYLGQLGDLRYIEPVTCGTCHQGQSTPPGFVAKPAPATP
ncbi:MAG: c-type cytochrome [Steroidobacteraceae bacterium]